MHSNPASCREDQTILQNRAALRAEPARMIIMRRKGMNASLASDERQLKSSTISERVTGSARKYNSVIMARSYRRLKKIPPAHRARFARALWKLVFFRAVFPTMVTTMVFAGIVVGIVHLAWPQVDMNSPYFIFWFVLLLFATAIIAFPIYNAMLMRWFLRYRSQRHGLIVALGDVLRASDAKASFLRRIVLSSYGVTPEDLKSYCWD